MISIPANSVLTVSGLTELIRDALEPAFSEIWVRGEVSNFRRQESGHCYFSLKDEGAQLPCVLFRQSASRVEFPIRDGMSVAVFGRISVYPPRGGYQLVCQFLIPGGEGSLAEKFEALKRKLESEGLFDKSRKKPLPSLPRSIGIITSPTGAVLQDFLSVLSRRGWKGKVTLLPAKVQGEGAAGEIARMVKLGGSCGLFDLIVLARGGGSLEDLWPFNEELVARAVAACPVPTISGVGHETDFTLCDFAASVRAETPSAAAELISSLRIEAEERVMRGEDDLHDLFGHAIEIRLARLNLVQARLRAASPAHQIETATLRLVELSGRLESNLASKIDRRRLSVERMDNRVESAGPKMKLPILTQRLDQISLRLISASPKNVLMRGYAIVRGEGGGVKSDASKLATGEKIRVEFRDGERGAEVT
jgi:exodeoxyribonuclease VII large subunit